MRIGFAPVATQLLAVTGLLLARGLLLLWVCWTMYEELRFSQREELAAVEVVAGRDLSGDGAIGGGAPRKTLRQAVTETIVADVSMSLDHALAVAGAAQEHAGVLVFGLVLSVALMGVASSVALRPRHAGEQRARPAWSFASGPRCPPRGRVP